MAGIRLTDKEEKKLRDKIWRRHLEGMSLKEISNDLGVATTKIDFVINAIELEMELEELKSNDSFDKLVNVTKRLINRGAEITEMCRLTKVERRKFIIVIRHLYVEGFFRTSLD